jgi:hypothetical protein
MAVPVIDGPRLVLHGSAAPSHRPCVTGSDSGRDAVRNTPTVHTHCPARPSGPGRTASSGSCIAPVGGTMQSRMVRATAQHAAPARRTHASDPHANDRHVNDPPRIARDQDIHNTTCEHGARLGRVGRPCVTPHLPSQLAVVCHDAGATQLILPWLNPSANPVRAFMQGPAAALWRARFGTQGLVDDLNMALAGADLLLSGTSLVSDLEHRARRAAQSCGLHAVAVIDHWTQYAARFHHEGQRLLPDELWVCDAEAYALARATFPGHPLRLWPNAYQYEQIERLAPSPDPNRRQTVLLLPEPVGSTWGHALPGEEQALDFLLAHAHRLGLRRPLTLRLRPDDRDPPGRWNAWIERHHGTHDVELDVSPSLAEALDPVAWVAGLESPALVLALATQRRAVCLQPPWAPRARLPQRGLIHLRDLLPTSPGA